MAAPRATNDAYSLTDVEEYQHESVRRDRVVHSSRRTSRRLHSACSQTLQLHYCPLVAAALVLSDPHIASCSSPLVCGSDLRTRHRVLTSRDNAAVM